MYILITLCINVYQSACRSKRLAPVLIKEITRRVNLTGRWQAAYTAGVSPTAVHTPLQPKPTQPTYLSNPPRSLTVTVNINVTITPGVLLPKPVGKCRYWHRSLNPKKLVECKFTSVPHKSTLAGVIKQVCACMCVCVCV